MVYSAKDISAVVCCLNSISSVERCLVSLGEAKIGEIIFVDGGSVDGSLEIGRKYAHIVLNDSGAGLSAARNLGISFSSKPLILNFGPDNELDDHNLKLLLHSFSQSTASGVGMMTTVEGNNYWANALNFWRMARFTPGRVNVIGTPSLFDSKVLKEFGFNESRRFSDDGELAERLRKLGHGLELAPSYAKEVGTAAFFDIWIRWRMYGISDAEYLKSHWSSKASIKTLLRSFLHAFRNDFLLPIRKFPLRSFPFIPALIVMVGARYVGLGIGLRGQRPRRFRSPSS